MIEYIFLFFLSSFSYTFFLHVISIIVSKTNKINFYKITGIKLKKFLKQHVKNYSVNDNEEPSGFFIDKKFLGYISSENNKTTMYILLSEKNYREMIENDNKTIIDTKEEKKITIYDREGNFYNISYNKRKHDHIRFSPTEIQKEIIDKIVLNYNENKFSTVLLTGDPGNGKSVLPYLISKTIFDECSITDTFNPNEPGDTLNNLYIQVEPEFEKPLIIVFEEVDGIINNIHNNLTQNHKNIPTEIKDKKDWNMFFDKVQRGLFLHTIFILTSNKKIEYFDSLDSSYMRDKRINLKFHM